MIRSKDLMRVRVATLFVALLASCLGLWGQATTASSITGIVTDSTNAAIPGADVILTDLSTKIAHAVSTNEAGRYIFPNLDPGNYSITVSKQGFAKSEIPSQNVELSSTLTLNFKLELGTSTTTVEVRAVSGAELQTTNAAVGTTINGAALESLPNFGRDVTTLSVLQPGTTLGGYTAGAVQDQNTYTLDGGNNSDDMSGNNTTYTTNFTGIGGTQTGGNASGVMPTPVESIEEIKVNSFNQTADFNSSIGGQVVMATKRGSNQFHGSGYGYYFDTAFGAANTWTNDHTPFRGSPFTPIVSNHRTRYGFSIGGPITNKKFLGGRTYFFFNLEDLRFPNSGTYERLVPTAAFRAGVIQVAGSNGAYIPYNLNSSAVSVPVGNALVNPVSSVAPAVCPAGACDPRGIGLNPIVNQIWSKYMPLPNDPTYSSGDQYNTQGFLSTIRAPLNSNNYVGRIDHDFGDKWRFYSSYRDQRLISLTTNQVDIGGAIGADKFGVPAALAPRTQIPDYFVTGLTTNISPTITNTFLFNYIRNFWQWSDNSGAQIAGLGLGGALEIGGESTNALIPFNVNTQSVRQRFWDGHDQIYKDDLTVIKGNHLIQFGGSYQRNFDYHTRSDNGNGINNAIVYQSTSAAINSTGFSPYTPSTVPSTQTSTYNTLYSEALGFVSQPQVAYTRQGANLTIQPVGSFAFDKSVIPTYSGYVSDTWHVKPTFTVIYGLGYTLEMPPYETSGKQIALVDQGGQPISTANYIANKQNAALQGQAYDPIIGYEAVRNVGTGLKYPYNPVYNEFAPRVAAAWSPNYDSGILGKVIGHGKTVIRGGYGRIYGRLNGVNLVLVPLLGAGLIQATTCLGPTKTGTCAGTGNVDPTNIFRIGTDGGTAPLPAPSQTLPQPFFPGVNGASAGDLDTLDPNFRPETTDNFTMTIQREVSRNSTIEVGYIGRKIRHEGQEINLDAVPYMMTLNNQKFSQAYANMYLALCGLGPTCANNSVASVPAQPFIESALGGPTSAYCSGYSSCTTALLTNQKSLVSNTAVSDLWAAMNKVPSWTLGRTMISSALTAGSGGQVTSAALSGSLGYGNYNGLFVTYRLKEWKGMSMTSNFTWSRALGTAAQTQASSSFTALDAFDLHAGYGPNSFDTPLIFNVSGYYRPDFYKTQKGVIGHVLGGWTLAPLFFAQSGAPIAESVGFSEGSCTSCQAFGENTPTGATTAYYENAVFSQKYSGAGGAHYNNFGSNGIGTNNSTGINYYANPAAVYNDFRRCILGFDTSCGGYGNIRNLPQFNLDAQLLKDVGVWKEGKVGATLSFQVTNVLNHMQPSTPGMALTSPTTFGKISGQSNTPRNMEFGIRVHF